MPFRERPIPGTRRPFSCRAEMHAKGACNHFEPDGTVPFDSIRTVSWWTRRAAPPAPIQRVLRVGVGGRQAGYAREPTLLSTGKSPFSPSPLFPSPLSYLPTRTITRLHGYPRYLDSSRVLGRLFPTHRLSCAHPSSAGSLSMAGTGCRRGEHRATAVKALGGRH